MDKQKLLELQRNEPIVFWYVHPDCDGESVPKLVQMYQWSKSIPNPKEFIVLPFYPVQPFNPDEKIDLPEFSRIDFARYLGVTLRPDVTTLNELFPEESDLVSLEARLGMDPRRAHHFLGGVNGPDCVSNLAYLLTRGEMINLPDEDLTRLHTVARARALPNKTYGVREFITQDKPDSDYPQLLDERLLNFDYWPEPTIPIISRYDVRIV